MATTDLRITSKVELETLAIVRPGDSLIVAVRGPLDADTVDEYHTELTRRLPGVQIIIVEATALAVYRPDGG